MTDNNVGRNPPPQSPNIGHIFAAICGYLIAFLLLLTILHLYVVAPETPTPKTGGVSTSERMAPAPASLDSTKKKDLIQAVAFTLTGGAAAIGIYFTWKTFEHTLWSSRENLRLATASLEETQNTIRQSREQQSAERFTAAINQIGDDSKEELRLGGIYALETLVRDNEEYHRPIIEVLSAYVRTNYPAPNDVEGITANQDPKVRGRFDIDVILAIFKRTLKRDTYSDGQKRPVAFLNLRDADLRGADLQELDLQSADLSGAFLYGADFTKANLKGVDFRHACLMQVKLIDVDFTEVNFERADIRFADLEGVENYSNVKSIKDANVRGVERAPDGFVEWAIEQGGASIEEYRRWRDRLAGIHPEEGNDRVSEE